MSSGERRAASGERRAASGERRAASGELTCLVCAVASLSRRLAKGQQKVR